VNRHVIVHQFDPTRHVVGGIDGFIRDLIEHSGEQHEFAVVGVERGRGSLGRWRTVQVGERSVKFMPVARLEAGNQRRLIPHSLRLAYGLVRYRPAIDGAIVHSHRAEIGAVVAGLFRDAKRVQFLHGNSREAFRWRRETMWRFAPRVYELLERLATRSADTTLVMSRSGLEHLKRHSARVELGSNWFDGRYFHTANRERLSPPHIGWAGRLEPPKDPLKAIEVFANLRGRGVQFEAWLAGSGTLEADVRAAIERFELGEVVRLVGVLAPADLAAELRRSDTFLMTSLWEGIPRTVIEALACGVPVVSTAVGEAPAFVRDNVTGFVSDSGTVEDLADATVRALELEPGAAIAASVEQLEARRVVPELLEHVLGASRT
jgi:glycosyltransferase involved in cell wall biosynthesis